MEMQCNVYVYFSTMSMICDRVICRVTFSMVLVSSTGLSALV